MKKTFTSVADYVIILGEVRYMGTRTFPAVKDTDSKAYDKVVLWVKHGDKSALREHAEAMGESFNAFVRRALYATMEQDNKK